MKTKLNLDWSSVDRELLEEEFNHTENDMQKSICNLMRNFEMELLIEAVKLKSKDIYAVYYTSSSVLGNCWRSDIFYKFFKLKEDAEKFLNTIDTSVVERRYISEYHFDKILDMTDKEFEDMPDLGEKEMYRKYREAMREQG